MEKKRYMLICMNKYIYRFEEYEQAETFAVKNCRGIYQYYIIVDTLLDEVLYQWSY